MAHFFTMWGFTILLLTIIEAYGDLFHKDFPIPGHRARGRASASSRTSSPWPCWWPWSTFTIIRLKNSPERKERQSRFYGSHTGAAWLVLAMIALVMITLLALPGGPGGRRADSSPTATWAFASHLVGKPLRPLGGGRQRRTWRRCSCS